MRAALPRRPPPAPLRRTDPRPPRQQHAEGPRDENLARIRRDDSPRGAPEEGFETFRSEVGQDHGVQPGNIVGAIANEAGLDSKNIGRVDIRDDHSLVDLPSGMPAEIFARTYDRSVLSYFIKPLSDQIMRAFRER